MPRAARTPVLLVLVAFVLVAVLPVDAPDAAGRYRTLRKRTLAPGLVYRKIKDNRGPNRIFVLTVNLSRAVTIDAALAGDQLGVRERTSSMAKRHGATAAINGDFGSFSNRPAFHFVEDGSLISTSLAFGHNFAVSYDETLVHIGHPQLSLETTEGDTGEVWRIRRWNDPDLGFGEIGGYTSAGGSLARPPQNSCSARLAASSEPQWAEGQRTIATDYTVQQSVCQESSLAPNGGVVLSARPGSEDAEVLRSLAPGEALRLAWSLGWQGVLDAVGGTPMLLHDGQVLATACSASVCRRHPRTGVGLRADGRLLLVVVDGRQPGYSVGMTLVEFAELFRHLGAVEALNLDGGGSSTMVVKGKVVNRPSDGHERSVVNAILVLPGPDGGEVVPVTGTATSAETGEGLRETTDTRAVVTATAPTAASGDAGSTGGLTDALARGTFAPRRTLHPDLARVLRVFRSSR